MLIENLVKQILDSSSNEQLAGCSDNEVELAEAEFHKKFHMKFPDGYKTIVRLANGIDFNGLIIWSVKPSEEFKKTISQINTELRHIFSEDYLYFGKKGEDLFVYHIKNKMFYAIDYIDKSIENQYENAEAMFECMLKCSLNVD